MIKVGQVRLTESNEAADDGAIVFHPQDLRFRRIVQPSDLVQEEVPQATYISRAHSRQSGNCGTSCQLVKHLDFTYLPSGKYFPLG